MHEGQWDVTVTTVEQLVARQFPLWRDLPVVAVPSQGTVNALFRLGDAVVLRFALFPVDDPRRRDELLDAHEHLATIAGQLTVPVPVPLAVGSPGEGYPGFWAALEWIPGEVASPSCIGDLEAFAADLARCVQELHRMPTGGRSWDGRSRGGPLSDRDAQVRRCIADSGRWVQAARVEAVWDACVSAPRGSAADTWVHADLMPGNLLVRDGRLAAVIDWEMVGVGDPAVDLMPAWNLLPAGPRETFRRALAPDDDTWDRGRGWALCQAVVALPYYAETNKGMADNALHTLAALLDPGGG
jgi:aminoglycoside phosphotransferase (APT) family kinase protein